MVCKVQLRLKYDVKINSEVPRGLLRGNSGRPRLINYPPPKFLSESLVEPYLRGKLNRRPFCHSLLSHFFLLFCSFSHIFPVLIFLTAFEMAFYLFHSSTLPLFQLRYFSHNKRKEHYPQVALSSGIQLKSVPNAAYRRFSCLPLPRVRHGPNDLGYSQGVR